VGSLAGGGLVPSYIPRLHVGVKRYDVTTLFLDDFKVRHHIISYMYMVLCIMVERMA
jgi:hypothetical protein